MTEAPDLWAKARERLPEDVQEWLSNLNDDSQQSPIGAQLIDELISEAHKKQEELEKGRHNFILKAGKHKLELRLVFENMIKWIDKFKGIGDVVSSFDPVHAALPWAAFRFVLQHLVAEQEHAQKFVELLASIPRLLFTGRVFELVYTKKSMHLEESQYGNHIGLESLHYLHREIVDLYSGLLSALQFSGAGKTFLTSRVVDFVVENAKRNEAVAFFYCKRDEENRRNPQDIFRSILRQLSSDIVSDERKIHPLLKSLPDSVTSNLNQSLRFKRQITRKTSPRSYETNYPQTPDGAS
ncbi:hypothetical protein K4K54_001049 [Colletotrichum sp. SAR 10_86]|nr:hypothetical protein K4K52_004050 [Colletotrichum sp. SAR 10_76]KAI8237103.1 hypothetical protein K4K54_001049 [Colletotrichum sp. SAR 10_86]